MTSKSLGASVALATMLFASAVEAGVQRPHPVFAWKGNQYLFDVKPVGNVVYLTGYRALGSKWQFVGTTRIQDGQKVPRQGFLQRIWFQGQPIGTVVADMSNPWWRHYPADDREGGRGGGTIDP